MKTPFLEGRRFTDVDDLNRPLEHGLDTVAPCPHPRHEQDAYQLHAVEQVCSEVAVMVKGEIVFRAPTDQLRSRVKGELT